MIHTCKAMKKVSLESCMMDNLRTGQNGNSQAKIVNDCCSNQLLAGHLNSQYISVTDHKIESAKLVNIIQVFNYNYQIENVNEINFLYINSPPVYHSSPVFITNLTLLI